MFNCGGHSQKRFKIERICLLRMRHFQGLFHGWIGHPKKKFQILSVDLVKFTWKGLFRTFEGSFFVVFCSISSNLWPLSGTYWSVILRWSVPEATSAPILQVLQKKVC